MAFRLRWPTEFGVITQEFNVNPHWYKPWGFPGHEGLDFKAPNGSKVFACAEGVVDEVRLEADKPTQEAPYGNQVRIRHDTEDGEFLTIYAHLKEVHVEADDQVRAGDLIGLANETGNSWGPHLHLTLKKTGATEAGETSFPRDIVDPTPYLDPFEARDEEPEPVDDLHFQSDITIPDGSEFDAGTPFVKKWRVLNAGTTTWGEGYKLAHFADDPMGDSPSVELPVTAPAEIATVSVPLTAPQRSGEHRSTWRAKNPQGDFFGQILFALIRVPADDEDRPLNGIVDLSHHNAVTDWATVHGDGIVAVIHKATQGTTHVDTWYHERKAAVLQSGMLWAAYHFGDGQTPIDQARHFLETVRPDGQTVLALDFERNPNGSSMTLTQAEQFVQHVFDETGKWPLLYTGRWYIREYIGDNQPTILSNCPLWIASWTERPFVPSQWPTWAIWQYTNGLSGPEPHDVAGLARCDRNIFNGGLDDLRRFWAEQAP